MSDIMSKHNIIDNILTIITFIIIFAAFGLLIIDNIELRIKLANIEKLMNNQTQEVNNELQTR